MLNMRVTLRNHLRILDSNRQTLFIGALLIHPTKLAHLGRRAFHQVPASFISSILLKIASLASLRY